jgi:hypothetical protein
MKVKVRTHPVDVYYLTGNDARRARVATQSGDAGDGPCFTTGSFGEDGFAWDTCEAFEQDYRLSFPGEKLG